MNSIQFFISPIAGSVIGYFTNWLAIKMLFRPHVEKRILGIRVPFTPGLIPKEKNRIAKKVGSTVGEHLLTEEVLVKALTDQKVIESLRNIISDIFFYLRRNEENLDDILIKVLGDNKNKNLDLLESHLTNFIMEQLNRKEVVDGIASFIVMQVESMLDKKIEDIQIDKFINLDFIRSDLFRQWTVESIIEYKDKLQKEERTLSQMIPILWIDKIKEIIKEHLPNLLPLITEYMDKPFIEQKIKQILLDLIQANLGKLALMFVDGDKIYESFIKYIKEYTKKEEKQEEMIQGIYRFMNYILEKPAKEWINQIESSTSFETLEDMLNELISYITKEEHIKKFKIKATEYMNNKGDGTLLDIIKKINPSLLYDLEQWSISYFETLLYNEKTSIIIKLFLSKEIKRFLSIPIYEWMQGIRNPVEDTIKNITLKYYKDFITKQSSHIAKILNIPNIVEERIIEFETDYTEKIILSVVDRELKAITWLGAVLGFIIGFFPVLLNL